MIDEKETPETIHLAEIRKTTTLSNIKLQSIQIDTDKEQSLVVNDALLAQTDSLDNDIDDYKANQQIADPNFYGKFF